MKPGTEGRVEQQAMINTTTGEIDKEMIALRIKKRNITVAYVRARDADFFEHAFNAAQTK